MNYQMVGEFRRIHSSRAILIRLMSLTDTLFRSGLCTGVSIHGVARVRESAGELGPRE